MITLQPAKPVIKAPSVHLPLGISFFTFHGLSYIIDLYRKEVQVEWNPVTLGLYFSFFPQLIAGPIVRYHDVAQQLIENREFNRKEFAQGVVKFTLGLSKKMLIANTVGAVADTIFTLPLEKLDVSHAWVGLLTYTLQIYFDFSGYSDMAIGLAHMFGIRFLENFNYPYVSRSIREFWRRWHISLSNWFRDYLYISLGGNRVSERRVYLNLLTVFLLCGLWHGASWNFFMWGVRRVVMGKRGWLFINEDEQTDPRGFSGWQGYNPYSLNQLMDIQKHLEGENNWFTQQNVTFLILPAPDKQSIYSEYLPWQYGTIVGPSRQAQIFEYMKSHSKLQLIDVRQALLTAKKQYGLYIYFKTDSHWNNVGAFCAYEAIMKRLLVVYPQFVPHRFEDFVADRNLKREGDLAKMANLDVSHILEHQLVPKKNASFYSGGPKKDKILFFGDSFSHAFFKDYFWKHFNDVKFSSGGRTAKAPLEKHTFLQYRPDVVIFESVERYWTNV
ncbi:unnamed protein product [Rotaria sp. Silwood1]|nr:unnamed protein product [Rotaria sp. Silwood1]